MYKYFYYVYIFTKNSFEQKKKIIFQMVNHTVFLLFSLYLYKYVYELLPQMHNRLPFPNAIWSMSVYFMVFWLGLRNIERKFRDDITSGNIEMYLLRPISYIWQKVLMQIGQSLVPFIFAFTLSFLIDILIVGLPVGNPITFSYILSLVIVFVLSQILTCLLFVLVGLSGFWLENSEPVYFIVSKLIMILGGAWVPVAFFPHTLQLVAEFSPFGASMAMAFAMYPHFLSHFSLTIFNLVFWIFVCGVLVKVISGRAFKKLSING